MTAPEKPDTTPKPEGTPNAPTFTDQTAAREITRLNGLLEASTTENTRLKAQVQTLEGQVDEKKQAELQAQMDALKTENDQLKAAAETAKAESTRTAQAAALSGKVRDPDAALRLLTDDLKDKDGNPDVEKIIAKYPYLAPDGVTVPTAPNGGGGPQSSTPTTLDAAVASKDAAAINAAFDAELKGAAK